MPVLMLNANIFPGLDLPESVSETARPSGLHNPSGFIQLVLGTFWRKSSGQSAPSLDLGFVITPIPNIPSLTFQNVIQIFPQLFILGSCNTHFGHISDRRISFLSFLHCEFHLWDRTSHIRSGFFRKDTPYRVLVALFARELGWQAVLRVQDAPIFVRLRQPSCGI